MSLASWIFGRLCKLPSPLTRDVAAEPLRIRMRDGSELLADRYYPRHAGPVPTVLIRSCYGRDALKVFGTLFAERGMQVVMQSCRGTAGSQGIFRPFFDEEDDGADTVEWIERQTLVLRQTCAVGYQLPGEHSLGHRSIESRYEGGCAGLARNALQFPRSHLRL